MLGFRADQQEKDALEAVAEAQGRRLTDLLRGVTHDLVTAFQAGQKVARSRAGLCMARIRVGEADCG